MFIGYQNNKIAFVAKTREELENLPCVTLDKIEETDKTYFIHNGEYVFEVPVEELQAEVRAVRNQYLTDTDKFMIADYPVTAEEREQYKAYRQYLRDYTQAEEWYKDNPLRFEEWLLQINNF